MKKFFVRLLVAVVLSAYFLSNRVISLQIFTRPVKPDFNRASTTHDPDLLANDQPFNDTSLVEDTDSQSNAVITGATFRSTVMRFLVPVVILFVTVVLICLLIQCVAEHSMFLRSRPSNPPLWTPNVCEATSRSMVYPPLAEAPFVPEHEGQTDSQNQHSDATDHTPQRDETQPIQIQTNANISQRRRIYFENEGLPLKKGAAKKRAFRIQGFGAELVVQEKKQDRDQENGNVPDAVEDTPETKPGLLETSL